MQIIRRDDSNLRFSRQLAKIQIAALIVAIVVVGVMTLWISREHNSLSEASTKQMVSGGISALEDKLQTITLDYSLWVPAYEAIRARDARWIWENIGATAASDTAAADLMMIVEPGEGAWYGWVSGMGDEPSADLLPTDVVRSMLRLLDNVAVESMQAPTQFVRVGDETWLLAITRVLPFSNSLPAGLRDEDLPRHLFGLKIDDALMAELGDQFLLDDLRIARARAPGMSNLPLGDRADLVGYAVWTPQRPGDVILGRIAVPLLLSFGAILIASLLVSRHVVASAKRLERAVDAAEAADRAKTEFLSNISHELRTPMNGIIGIGQLMQGMKLEPKLDKMVGVLMTSAQSQMRLIEGLLDFARIESGTKRLDLAPFDPVAALTEVRDLMVLKADGKGIALDVDAPVDPHVHVMGDKGCYKQVLTNLIDNAIKFTDHGAVSVRMRARAELNELRITLDVADTGPGIDPRDHKLIFQRFYQLDGASTRRAGGAGLGLAITKSLVELMGGQLSLKSALGEGAVFTTELTMEIAANPNASRAAA